MNYQQTLNKMYGLQKFGIKLGLSSTENLLERLGNPQDDLKILHLAGSNGKGSVGAHTLSILREAGYRVGFYTSPHLVSFRERFRINNNLITKKDVVRLADMVWDVCDQSEPPTFFEFVTAMAFVYFKERQVDLAIMETGLGGRLDATNVAKPLVGVITNISLEHTEYLGPTLSHVAREKAGIIKPGMAVVTGEKRKKVLEIFETTCRRKRAKLFVLGQDFTVRRTKDYSFNYTGPHTTLKNLKTNLPGPHQAVNAAMALTSVNLLAGHGFKVTESYLRAGLKSVFWPGRAEKIPGEPGKPDLMLDGAHNPGAARVLAKMLAGLSYRRIHMVLGIMADKDIATIMHSLLPKADRLYLTRPEYERAAAPEVLADFAKGYKGPVKVIQKLPEAIETARSEAGADDLVVITGSLFTVGEARAWLLGDQD